MTAWLPRFPPLEVCGRRPPVRAAPPSWGRHPFTETALTDWLDRCPLRVRPTSSPSPHEQPTLLSARNVIGLGSLSNKSAVRLMKDKFVG
jgi:hypothetical protein